jgi:hypothetical protein
MTNQKIANVVVAVLNQIELDGETMEHIINEVGMRDQVIKQLVPQDDTVKPEQGEFFDPRVFVWFSKQQLIDYTREIQERCQTAALEAIRTSGVDMESNVELELGWDKTIDVSVDEDAIYSEICSCVEDMFETDDESILDEACNVLKNLGGV